MDELLECLVAFSKLNNNPYSADALIAGLPWDKNTGHIELFGAKSQRSLFSRAAERAGFASSLVKKPLREIPRLVMPCILLLKNKRALILLSHEEGESVVIFAGMSEPSKIKTAELEAEYLGFCFYLKKRYTGGAKIGGNLIDRSAHWFWGTLKKSRSIYADVLIASFIINLFVLASPLFTMNVYDRVVPNSATDTLFVLAAGVFVVYVLDLVLKLFRAHFLENAQKRSDIIMSSMIFEHVLDIKLAARPKSVGSFAQNLKEFDALKSFFASASIAAIVDLPFAVIFLLTIYFLAGKLVVVPIIVMILILIYTFSIRKKLAASIEATYEASAHKNGILIESLNTLETIKTLGAASNAQWVYEEATGEIAQKSIKHKMLSASVGMVTGFLVQVNTIAIVYAGVYMIKDMQLSMGALIASVILSSRAIAPMGQVASLVSQFEQTKASFKSLEKIMKLPSERPSGKKFIRRNNLSGEIEFKNVSFAYPEAKIAAINGLNLKIKRGEKVAVLGRNGSGKTTLQKLMLGLYEPADGQVLIDGIDLAQIDPADLRAAINYVGQDVVLFKGTVRENIAYKDPSASDEMIINAAEVSGVSEFVNAHPEGFDMPVLERGEGLSGGQRQGIAIARALLKPAPILLLDEPTNSLDSQAESRLIKRLKAYAADATLVVITHKNSLLELAERVVVIDKGRVVMDGPKEQILAKLGGSK